MAYQQGQQVNTQQSFPHTMSEEGKLISKFLNSFLVSQQTNTFNKMKLILDLANHDMLAACTISRFGSNEKEVIDKLSEAVDSLLRQIKLAQDMTNHIIQFINDYNMISVLK